MKKKSRKHTAAAAADSVVSGRRRWWVSVYLWVPLVALADTLIVEAFNHKLFTAGGESFARFFRFFPLAFWVNFLLVLVTLAPALFLRRRVFWCALLSALWLIAGGVNGFILMSRMTPFTTADLTVLNTGLDTLPNYMSTGYIVLLAAAIVLLLVFLVLLFLRGPKNGQNLRRRLALGTVAVAASCGALAGVWGWAQHVGQLSTTFPNLAFAYEDYGFPYCFLQTWLNKGIRQPLNYSETDVDRIRTAITDSTPQTTPQTDVNVVYVQLESFMDPTEFIGTEYSQDPVPTWHALEQQFTTGYLRVPVVGAGTANTEFEVLTGMSSRLFGPGEYPYKTCLQNKAIESIATDLKSLGYAAHAIHNHRATFYTRNTVYANLDFDDFTSLEYMPWVTRTPKGWSKDYVLTSQISKALDSTPGRSDLVFTVSVQGHGSYPTEEMLIDPAVQITACPDNINSTALEYYVNQIHEMDEFVGELVKALSERDEKTILVLYGDHLPSLNLESSNMRSGSLYKTRYLVWNNFGLKKEDTDVNAYRLSASVLKKLDISDGLLLQYQQYCTDQPNYLSDLKELQYDVLYGRDYLYSGDNPFTASDMKMGVAKILIQGMYQRDGFWYVNGENFSPYCKVTVDGKILDTSYVNTTLLRIDEDPGTRNYKDLVISVVDMHKEVLSDTE